jgi:hypothetical protein
MTETNNATASFVGINPDDVNKKLNSWGISFDEIVQKIASLGLPGIILVIAISVSGGTAYPIVAGLLGLGGPLGVLGGLGVLGLSTIIGDLITGYGIEAVLKLVYKERRKKETQESLIKEVEGLPISETLKLHLKHSIEVEIATEEPITPKQVEIVDE